MLYLSENETPREAFFYAVYGMELRNSPVARIIFFPFILLFALLRILANATCRNPAWPEEIERISKIAPDDPYSQPSGNTPVGWAETVLAKQRGEFPSDPKHKYSHWKGNPDTQVNLQQWLMDKPPKHLIQS